MYCEDEKALKRALNGRHIPKQGSLGLLAFGDLGLKYWRLSKEEQQKKTR